MVTLFAILLFASDAFACRCSVLADLGKSEKTLLNEAKEKADVVFVGKIIEIRFSESMIYNQPQTLYAKFMVEKSWKGVNEEFIEISTSNTCCTCGVEFEKGKRYLIYAYKGDSGEYSTNICTRTRSSSKEFADEKHLGEPIKVFTEEKN